MQSLFLRNTGVFGPASWRSLWLISRRLVLPVWLDHAAPVGITDHWLLSRWWPARTPAACMARTGSQATRCWKALSSAPKRRACCAHNARTAHAGGRCARKTSTAGASATMSRSNSFAGATHAPRCKARAARGGRTKVSAAVLLNWNPIINSGGGLHKGAKHVEQEQRFGYPR